MAVEPWWAMKVSFPDHPKVEALAAELKMDKYTVMGRILSIMRWVRVNNVLGVLDGRHLAEKIARETEWPGDPNDLFKALVKVGWIDKRDDGRYFFHDWDDHNAALIRGEHKKEQSRDRQRRFKARERLAQVNRYNVDPALTYPAVMNNALGNASANAQVTRYPLIKEKAMLEKDASKNLSKSTLFDASAMGERDITRERLLDPNIKHPHTRIIQFFLDQYKATRGENYIGPRDRMARNIKLIKQQGFDEEAIAHHIKNFFLSTDPYYKDDMKFDWGIFVRQFNRFDKPVHKDQNNSNKRGKDNGFDKPKGTEQTIDDFQ